MIGQQNRKQTGICLTRGSQQLTFWTLTLRFIGEESVAAGERLELTDSPTWIIDPIDGTVNFVHRSEARPSLWWLRSISDGYSQPVVSHLVRQRESIYTVVIAEQEHWFHRIIIILMGLGLGGFSTSLPRDSAHTPSISLIYIPSYIIVLLHVYLYMSIYIMYF